MINNKEGKMSKTKLGAVLIGLGAVLGTVGGWMSGSIDAVSALQGLLIEVGAVATLFGFRDLNIFNGITAQK